jgi:hypothetical protein
MPAAMTIDLSNSLLNAVLRQTSYTSPAGVYLACFTTDPTATGGGTEVTGGSYLRPLVTFNTPSGGTCSNANELNIVGMPAVTVRGLALMSASSAGQMLFYGSLTQPKVSNAGDTFTVKVGDLNVALI